MRDPAFLPDGRFAACQAAAAMAAEYLPFSAGAFSQTFDCGSMLWPFSFARVARYAFRSIGRRSDISKSDGAEGDHPATRSEARTGWGYRAVSLKGSVWKGSALDQVGVKSRATRRQMNKNGHLRTTLANKRREVPGGSPTSPL